jgi:hypothetical protein
MLKSTASLILALITFGAYDARAAAQTSQNAAPPRIALWSEFIPYAKVQALLPELKQRGLAVYVAVHGDQPDFDGFAALLTAAEKAGVEVRPWLLLREKDGYWFNKWNVRESEQWVWSFLTEMEKRGVKPSWLIWDIEPPARVIEQLTANIADNNYFGALSALKKSSENGSVLAAARSYSNLIQRLHDQGIHVHAVTGNFALNDLEAGDAKYQSALGTPISGVAWDEVSFMIYRVELKKFFGSGLTSRIVYAYSKIAEKHFGSKAAIDIGEAGQVQYPKPFTGYTDPLDLQKDAEAVITARINKIHIYSLDGMLDHGLGFWLDGNLKSRTPGDTDVASSFGMFLIDLVHGFLPDAH